MVSRYGRCQERRLLENNFGSALARGTLFVGVLCWSSPSLAQAGTGAAQPAPNLQQTPAQVQVQSPPKISCKTGDLPCQLNDIFDSQVGPVPTISPPIKAGKTGEREDFKAPRTGAQEYRSIRMEAPPQASGGH